MASKSGNTGKPKRRKQEILDDTNPVEFANSLIEKDKKKKEVNTMAKKEMDQVKEEAAVVTNDNTTGSITPEDMRTKKAQEMTVKFKDLIESGKTEEEAMAEVLKSVRGRVGSRTIIPDVEGLIARMKGLDNISELKRRIKIAFAKKSKSAGKPSEGKYEEEIKAGQARLNELIAICEAEETPEGRIRKYEELGEATGTILQMVLKVLEAEAEEGIKALKEKDAGLTLKAQKERIQEQPAELGLTLKSKLETFGSDYLERFIERLDKGDTRCTALARKYNYIG